MSWSMNVVSDYNRHRSEADSGTDRSWVMTGGGSHHQAQLISVDTLKNEDPFWSLKVLSSPKLLILAVLYIHGCTPTELPSAHTYFTDHDASKQTKQANSSSFKTVYLCWYFCSDCIFDTCAIYIQVICTFMHMNTYMNLKPNIPFGIVI